MRYYKVDQEAVEDLKFANPYSTLFDLKSYIKPGIEVTAFNPHQKQMLLPIRERGGKNYVQIQPQFRVIVSTGISFSIPVKYQLRVTSNKELSLYSGITLLDGTAVYDNDFTDELKLTLINNSDTPVYLFENEVIGQGTLAKVLEYTLEVTDRKVAVKTVKSTSIKDEGEETTEDENEE